MTENEQLLTRIAEALEAQNAATKRRDELYALVAVQINAISTILKILLVLTILNIIAALLL